MKELSFTCWCSYGEDFIIDAQLTDEEYSLLEEAIENGAFDWDDCEELADLYDRLYEQAAEQATADAMEYDEEFAEEYGEDEDFRIDDVYDVGVRLPDSLD